MTPDLLNLFENSLKNIKSISVIKVSDYEYRVTSSHSENTLPAGIVKISDNSEYFKLIVSVPIFFESDSTLHEQMKMLILNGLASQVDSPCKISQFTESKDGITAEVTSIFVDYAGVFNEPSRAEDAKSSDFKLITLSMITEIYSCSIAINSYITDTLTEALEIIRERQDNEKKQ